MSLESVIRDWGGQEVSAMEVYTGIFKLGNNLIQRQGEKSGDFKANPLGYWRNWSADEGHFRVMLDDTFEDTLKELQDADFSILNGITYFGRRNSVSAASKMYAMIFDLDGVTDKSLYNFINASIKADIYPLPNYIALSGHGVHLYYVFEDPVSLYPNIKTQLKDLKYALTRKMWNRNTSTIEKPQYQGINQGFRVIGGKTKVEGRRVRAFQMNTHPFSLRQLSEYVPEEFRVDEGKFWVENKLTLAEAKEKYPEWYLKIITGEKLTGGWTCKEDLYHWWLRKIEGGASFGHRYFCIMCLAIYAVKSGIDEETLRRDALALIPQLNELNLLEPFTEEDVESALECFDERYRRFPIKDLEKISGISIPKNKRNGRNQRVHLRLARSNRDILCDERGKENWWDGGGRPRGAGTKKQEILEWRKQHPEAKPKECIEETGISKNTVYKWWNGGADNE